MSSCLAKGDWEGEKDLNGSQTIQLVTVKTYEFILECTDADGAMVDESVSATVNDETDQNLDVAIIDEGRIANIWGGDASLYFFDELNDYYSCTSNVCPSIDWSFGGLCGKRECFGGGIHTRCWPCWIGHWANGCR